MTEVSRSKSPSLRVLSHIHRASSHENAVWWMIGAGMLGAALFVPGFLDLQNLANVARQSAVLGVLAIGQTYVITAGMIDLSVGQIAGLVVVLSSAMINGDTSMTLPVAMLMLCIGAGIGFFNGVLLNLLRLHPLILTFGMLSVLQGIIFTYTDRSVGRTSEWLSALANNDLFGIPLSAFLVIALAFGAHLVLTRTRFGYHLVAAGGNAESARRAGIRLWRIRLAVFVVSGITAALAGLLLAGRIGTGYPLAGNGLELDAIVAVVLGGTALSGGRGSVLRSLAGVVLLACISNLLNLLEVSAYLQMFIKGAIVVLAILLNQSRKGQA
ncbi:ABC transporter permease [Pseudohoeflea coraliihabitans]|uniref:ABC transporter permease n=1 Tax=Pseudohoeflea coraliihabitans TaxID=2860393 RepID=A0ABS6WSP8_9HYPH|nr:ABC transporter permease [Pseudohoeflea sp. DP4N28-3]MBW3098989.1 ABC transporter permease [Pseudohoeflea sp. DP4N28-3]